MIFLDAALMITPGGLSFSLYTSFSPQTGACSITKDWWKVQFSIHGPSLMTLLFPHWQVFPPELRQPWGHKRNITGRHGHGQRQSDIHTSYNLLEKVPTPPQKLILKKGGNFSKHHIPFWEQISWSSDAGQGPVKTRYWGGSPLHPCTRLVQTRGQRRRSRWCTWFCWLWKLIHWRGTGTGAGLFLSLHWTPLYVGPRRVRSRYLLSNHEKYGYRWMNSDFCRLFKGVDEW